MNNKIYVSMKNTGHVQGIATDKERKYMYFSFTTAFLKTDMEGNVVGSVTGLPGHIGCIAYSEEDDKVYASLEFKHDAIGRGVLEKFEGIDVEDGFYIAAFECNKITRVDMDAENDGVMTAVYLNEPSIDYKAQGHRFGCSGIDGITIAPAIGKNDNKKYVYVAYGIYSDVERVDNDYQIILRYDLDGIRENLSPLSLKNMHKSYPDTAAERYFLYTGNTSYGIQNLEYDPFRDCIFCAVYPGIKKDFPNFKMYAIDMKRHPERRRLKGIDDFGTEIFLKKDPAFLDKNGIFGSYFSHGSTGIASLGDGMYYISEDASDYEKKEYSSTVCLYKYDEDNLFLKISD